jgi:cystathionine beta-synthase
MAGVVQLREHFGPDDLVVVVFHDHGSRYMGKMYNDELLRAMGFLDVTGMTARVLVAMGVSGELYAVECSRPIEEAVRIMSDNDFSQISITNHGRIVGSLNEAHLYDEFVKDPELKKKPVEAIMQPAFPFVDVSTPVELLSTMISHENPAVLVRDFKTDKTFIITRSDIIRVLM